ncbi:MAG: butyrate kinase [Tenericutes bacterium GWC2_34_14]|nr:MAG: butyrate kinase [Tenericutes bacterium GWC2_34_14]OHE35033.1 MAG: butyrate kinase [Tenericutes bacterium GWE2_34_108]OHE37107.1 MAG: butyrate kinase [Tenericutes bacterium GWF1_35_14]OHE39761.1 MAG: butyrate kinase [Tenericutes bacterium GWF2_35_184]OHE43985.1 MAG: butyrate kinase [Tenericutes bacterium RIFOXYA12_FULL_35_10]OHE44051.1 MAG: butyrate kinase [Tenericutes bacterium RIFOXYA2_FULL_36_32]OHE47523.1 MAG: butyrate kinase [Tenericutes bacterium RIFOXYB2_FULL_36_25]OHE49446.1 M
MPYRILAINPGSTSTKLAIYEDERCVFKASVKHDSDVILSFNHVIDQYDFRMKAILEELEKDNIDLSTLSAVVGRGGMLKPIPSGTYEVTERMLLDMKEAKRGEHASNLGCLIAKHIADQYHLPSFIVDPVAVDEMEDIARFTGMPEIKRDSLFHALNQKAVARKVAKDFNKPYESLDLVIAHLGGGISIAAHHFGKVIDVNNALDGDGPMSPERSGEVPMGPLYKMALSGKYTLREIQRKNYGQGGLVAYLGTNDGATIMKRINEGDEKARFIHEVMCYQIAKEIGAYATVLKGHVDGIVLTGGLAYNKLTVELIKERVQFIAPVLVYPGEDEMEALALGALRVLQGEEVAKKYE